MIPFPYKAVLNTRLFQYILAAAALILAFWLFYLVIAPKVVSPYQRELANWKDSTQKLLVESQLTKTSDSLSKVYADSLMLVAALKDSVIYHQTDEIQRTKLKFDRRIEVLKRDTSTCIALCDSWKVTALGYKDLSDSLITVIKLDSTREQEQITAYRRLNIAFSSETMRADSLAKRLVNIPVYHEPKFLGFIPLPSRKASLVTGLISGVIVTSALFIAAKH